MVDIINRIMIKELTTGLIVTVDGMMNELVVQPSVLERRNWSERDISELCFIYVSRHSIH